MNNDHLPPCLFEKLAILRIPCAVPRNFLIPKGHPCLGQSKITATMAMPKTSVNKHYCTISWQHEIWGSRQILTVKSETISLAMQESTYQHFWLGIPAFDACHHFTAGCLVYDICHICMLMPAPYGKGSWIVPKRTMLECLTQKRTHQSASFADPGFFCVPTYSFVRLQ